MIPGEVIPREGEIELNADRVAVTLMVANTGDRPVQVGSHYHFAETNAALDFDRGAAQGMRLDIAAGTAVRFEPGQRREVQVIPFGGARKVFGFNGKVMGALALMLALMVPQVGDAQTNAECSSPQTQQLMNACAAKDYQNTDKALNLAWGPAHTYAKQIGQGQAMLDAQRAWLAYRDLACDVQASPYDGGSIQPLITYTCLSQLTAERTRMLLSFKEF